MFRAYVSFADIYYKELDEIIMYGKVSNYAKSVYYN